MKILQSQPNLNLHTSCNILASITNSLLDYINLSLVIKRAIEVVDWLPSHLTNLMLKNHVMMQLIINSSFKTPQTAQSQHLIHRKMASHGRQNTKRAQQKDGVPW